MYSNIVCYEWERKHNQDMKCCALHAHVMQVGEDPRPVMRAAYTAFQDGKEPDRIMAAINPMRGSHDTFYAQLVRVRSTPLQDLQG